ncbi:MAG TPA: hypothetical protein GX706_03380 [Candidatus Moranbacteria bacterium]|nr:hypothetical protein [Candidatus Moranbacteria bacterium]
MAQSFYTALQKRIKRGNSGEIDLDGYMIEKATKDVIDSLFGDIGLRKIRISFDKKGVLYLNSAHSVWRSELKGNLWRIKGDLNKKLKCKKNIKIIISD